MDMDRRYPQINLMGFPMSGSELYQSPVAEFGWPRREAWSLAKKFAPTSRSAPIYLLPQTSGNKTRIIPNLADSRWLVFTGMDDLVDNHVLSPKSVARVAKQRSFTGVNQEFPMPQKGKSYECQTISLHYTLTLCMQPMNPLCSLSVLGLLVLPLLTCFSDSQA